jgi:drug/metabolite transporter (DMT)-like permease
VQLGVALTQASFVLGSVFLKSNMSRIDEAKGEVFHPLVYAFLREVSAGPVLFLLSIVTVGYKIPGRMDVVKVLMLGFCMFLSQLLYIMGIELSGVMMASCIQPSVPVFTVLIGILLRLESSHPKKILGIFMAVGGAIAMVAGSVAGDGPASENPQAMYLGNFCILVNAVAMAVYYLLAKKLVTRYSAIHVAAWAYMVAATLMGVAAMAFTKEADWAFPRSMMAPLIYWIFVCSVGGYFVVTWAMNHLPASQVAAFQCLQPFIGTALAVMVLGEHVNKYDFGAIGIVLGLLLVTRSGSSSPHGNPGSGTQK